LGRRAHERHPHHRRLLPEGEATKVTITHEQFANTEDRDKHNEGWNGCLNRLQRTLTTAV